MMRRVIGIDPGLEDTGWAILSSDNGRIILENFGLIKTERNLSISKRLCQIYDGLNDIIAEFNPDAASIEEVFFIDKIRTQEATMEARGVILLAFEKSGIKYNEYNPRLIKKNITGNGNANKKQVQSVIKMMFSMDKELYPDIADAVAIGICDLKLYKLKEKGLV
ncbi:MAG: crossover junction endodeoxyribonuclease RuvC [Elusimicrobia bacterium]|jgi:crossover junction endodeoxyribonuclease RuvC|nr:crossover junction endodeoxyribonuclease RuvC [Elusimicrobiota bacterium]